MSKLLKNTSIYTLGAILPKLGAFIFLPIYLNYLTQEEYGIVTSMLVLNGFFVVFFTLCLPRSLYRIYYDYKDEKDKEILVGTITSAVLIIGLLVTFLMYVFNSKIELIFKDIPFFPYYWLTILLTFCQAIVSIPVILIQIKEKAFQFILLNIVFFILKSLLIFWFIIYKSEGVEGYLKGELIAAIISIPVYYFLIRKQIKFTIKTTVLTKTLLYSIPLIPGIFSAWILDLSDRIFIENYIGPADVGLYSLAYQISGVVSILTSSFKQAYDPYFYKIANTTEVKEAKIRLYKTNNLFLKITIFISFLVVFFSRELVIMFFDESYWEAFLIIPIISLSYVISQSIGLLNVMMYQEKKTLYTMTTLIVSALVNIILNFILIPRIGIYGAAWSTVASVIVNLFISYQFAKKTFFVPFNWKELLLIVGTLCTLFYIFYLFPLENIFNSIIIKTICVTLLITPIVLKNKTLLFSILGKK
jgi:O-antigen/teichoic acid export membrane protein